VIDPLRYMTCDAICVQVIMGSAFQQKILNYRVYFKLTSLSSHSDVKFTLHLQ